jgi:O-antigen/teichoic acid export membrane protein
MSHARTLARSTFVYSLPTLVGPLFTIVLTPIYARVIPTAELGVVETVTTLGMVVSVVGMLGSSTALSAMFHDQPDDAARQRLTATVVWMVTAWSALLALVCVLAAKPLAAFWVGDVRYSSALALYMLNLPFGALYSAQLAGLRLRQQAWRASGLAVAQVVLLAIWTVLLVVWLRLGAWGALGAQTVTYGCLALLSLVAAPSGVFTLPRPALARTLLLTGIPLIPVGLAAWALGFLDRPLLVQMGIGLDQIAIYAVANKLVSMLTVLGTPFALAWTPFALSIGRQPDAPRTYARALTWYASAMLVGGLGLGLFAHEALILIGTARFLPAEGYVWMLGYSPLVQGCYTIISTGLLVSRKTAHLAWTTALGAAVNLGLNLVLVPQLGVLGAAIATPLGYACGPLAAYIVCQRVYPVPYEWWRLALALLAQVALLAIGLPLAHESTLATVAARVALLAAYPIVLVCLGVIARADLARAWSWACQRVASRFAAPHA